MAVSNNVRAFDVLNRIDNEFNQILRNSLATGNSPLRTTWMPPVDLVLAENGDATLTLDLPGVNPETVRVEEHEGALTVSGTRPAPTVSGRTLVRELAYGDFKRRFLLPDGAENSHISANYQDGVLTVTIAQAVKPKPEPRVIPIGNAVIEEGVSHGVVDDSREQGSHAGTKAE